MTANVVRFSLHGLRTLVMNVIHLMYDVAEAEVMFTSRALVRGMLVSASIRRDQETHLC